MYGPIDTSIYDQKGPPKKIVKKPVVSKKKPQPPEKDSLLNDDKELEGNNDPFALNQGDDDMKPYLDPLLRKVKD